MSTHTFDFDLRIDPRIGIGALTDALSAEVLRHLGYADDAASDLGAAIHAAIVEVCAAGDDCDVRFRAAAGALEITVSAGSRATRRVVRPLPGR